MSYVEVRSHTRRTPKRLDHIRIHGNASADGHVVELHHDNGAVESMEFRHPEDNEAALLHLAQHMRLKPPTEGEEGEE